MSTKYTGQDLGKGRDEANKEMDEAAKDRQSEIYKEDMGVEGMIKEREFVEGIERVEQEGKITKEDLMQINEDSCMIREKRKKEKEASRGKCEEVGEGEGLLDFLSPDNTPSSKGNSHFDIGDTFGK